ncbi:PiggyBac transposable element-derived protein 4 [Trichinella nelsoni]|uniref:PiggyBac transposable element-derived protein 4 n=1 Tax=Trichinella nelsoni TaxID=6336 RepID=A0A0V0S5Z6_9BILA|nr:PiggyBac transposable element-derived protein 4 [Trichinella nelsoni]
MKKGRLAESNMMKLPPGPTSYTITKVIEIRSSFALFISSRIEKIILQMTNVEGKRRPGNKLMRQNFLLILAYSFWQVVMSLDNFQRIPRTIRFDDRETRSHRREKDSLAAIRDVWNDWASRLPMMRNPGAYVTVDERLIPFRSRCPFRQYMPKKTAKYGIKVWTLCVAKTSYAWNMQIYTGKRCVRYSCAARPYSRVQREQHYFNAALQEEAHHTGYHKEKQVELPQDVLALRGRASHSSKFVFIQECTVVSYISKMHRMVLLSTVPRMRS